MRRHAVLLAVAAAIALPVAAFAAVSMTVTPTSLSFPTQCTHTTSDVQAFRVSNNGDTSATDVSVSVSPSPMASIFNLGGQTGASQLDPGDSMRVEVGFTPQHVGTSSATAVVTYTDPGTDQSGGGGDGHLPPGHSPSPSPSASPSTGSFTVPLSGKAIDRYIDANPPGVNFGSVHNGKPGPKKTLTIFDDGFTPLHITGLFLGGRQPGDFTLGQPSSDVVTDGHPATVVLGFNPKAAGARAAELVINSDSCSGSLTVELAGISTEQDITASPKTVDFGTPYQGAKPTQLLSIINQGNFPLVLKSMQLVSRDATTTDAKFFSLTNVPKKFPLKLQPGQAVQLTVHLNTAELGQKQAVLKVTSDDPDHGILSIPINAETVAKPTPSPTQTASAPPPPKSTGAGFHLHLGAYVPTVAVFAAVIGFFWLLVMVRRHRGIPE
jgi:hypothetical protein